MPRKGYKKTPEHIAAHVAAFRRTMELRRKFAPSAIDHFFANTQKQNNGCLIWIGTKWNTGYGFFYDHEDYDQHKRPSWLAHRWIYTKQIGPIPDHLELDHRCRNRACVNLAHLELVTSAENTRRGMSPMGINSRKTHCKRGHRLTEENDFYRTSAGQRRCRICHAATVRRYALKKQHSVSIRRELC